MSSTDLTSQLAMLRHSLMLRMASLGRPPLIVMLARFAHPVNSSLSSLLNPVKLRRISDEHLHGKAQGIFLVRALRRFLLLSARNLC